MPLLQVIDLQTQFQTPQGIAPAVDRVSFNLRPGETLGIVGESGSGKSVLALSLMRLIADPPGRITDGQVIFQGCDLLKISVPAMRKIRGAGISMIFQEPMTSLNPVLSIGAQITESIRTHENVSRTAALDRAISLLRLVGIASPQNRVSEYPHKLSGGMRQRVMIAIALACNPKILIADEPTTALDVTIQAQILELLAHLKEELGMAMILITHDLGVVAKAAQRVCVMYAGRFVETAPVEQLFANPQHPYMKGLLGAIPRARRTGPRRKLAEIPGMVPRLTDLPGGCRFCPRNPQGAGVCKDEEPSWHDVGPDHRVRCWAVSGRSVQPVVGGSP